MSTDADESEPEGESESLLPPSVLLRRAARIAKIEAASGPRPDERTRDTSAPTMRELLTAKGLLLK